MSEIVIRIEGVGKKYKLKGKKINNLSESLKGLIRFSRNRKDQTEFWALKDINLNISVGDVLGIIGPNGAGKSTLLKIISRITKPSTGWFEIYGRVSSLLEVGTGFHPELSGRENIFLNGTILGMRRSEIKQKFDQIVDFSNVEQFLDTPVKHYSSGMKVRLAFSVAAFLEPEILIIDEVLAVGDAEFQKKCLGKMENVANSGRTVIFVSHNMGAVQKLCNQGIFIDKGEIKFRGTVSDTIQTYLNPYNDIQKQKDLLKTNEFEISDLFLTDNHSRKRNRFSSLEEIRIIQTLRIKKTINNFKTGIEIENYSGIKVISSYFNDKEELLNSSKIDPGEYTFEIIIPGGLFNSGEYKISFFYGIHMVKWIGISEKALSFIIDFTLENKDFNANKRDSIVAPMLLWNIN